MEFRWWTKAKPQAWPVGVGGEDNGSIIIFNVKGDDIVFEKRVSPSHLCSFEDNIHKFKTCENAHLVDSILSSIHKEDGRFCNVASSILAPDFVVVKRERLEELERKMDHKIRRIEELISESDEVVKRCVATLDAYRTSFTNTCDKVLDDHVKARKALLDRMEKE